jgi:hypothetical protein
MEVNMKVVVKKKKPLISLSYKRKRLDFTEAHKDWTVLDWKW